MTKVNKEQYSVKDFGLASIDTSMQDRIEQFKKWTKQTKDNDHQIYWIESLSGITPEMTIRDSDNTEKELISFISNDYLGMSQREETKLAGIEGLKKYGTGACAAPIIGGYLDIHKKLEQQIAEFTGQEDALIFSSGFGSNVGVLNALLGKNDLALIDTFVHSSVLDGIRSTNKKLIGHNDLKYLEIVLQREEHNYNTKMVIIDGVYSQDGDLGLIPEIKAICDKYNAILYVDDAHGIGLIGENGRGTIEHFGMLGKIDIITGTFSKAFGCVGGFVSASKDMIQYLRYYANTSVFSASPTPQVTCSVLKALELIKEDPSIRKKLWDNVNYLRDKLIENKFDIGKSESPVLPIMIRDTFKAKEVARLLKDNGIYAISIVYPAVSNKDARIRVSVLASHNKNHLDHLVNALVKIREQLKF